MTKIDNTAAAMILVNFGKISFKMSKYKRRNMATKTEIYKISQSWDFITRVPP